MFLILAGCHVTRPSALQFFGILLVLVVTEVTLALVVHVFHDQVKILSSDTPEVLMTSAPWSVGVAQTP